MTETDADPISVILIDDHQVVRRGVAAFLSTQPDIDVVGEAVNGAEGIALVGRARPDIALVRVVVERGQDDDAAMPHEC